MGRKAKYSKELKVKICKAFINGKKSALELARIYHIGKYGDDKIRYWIKQYQTYGSEAFDNKFTNKSYSREFKLKVVKEYFEGKGSTTSLAVKYNIPSAATLLQWILKYNSHMELKDYDPQSEIYMAEKLKTTIDERIDIVKYCLDHGRDIKGTAAHFGGNYAQIRQWVIKYEKNGRDGLIDRRGKRKQEEQLTELEKAQREIARLKKQNEEQRKTIELLKKVEALERRY